MCAQTLAGDDPTHEVKLVKSDIEGQSCHFKKVLSINPKGRCNKIMLFSHLFFSHIFFTLHDFMLSATVTFHCHYQPIFISTKALKAKTHHPFFLIYTLPFLHLPHSPSTLLPTPSPPFYRKIK